MLANIAKEVDHADWPCPVEVVDHLSGVLCATVKIEKTAQYP